jgi:hypothetical protein
MRDGVSGWVLACVLSSACNEADVLARYEVVSGPSANVDAGPAELDCSLHAQLSRKKLPTGLTNLFFNCEWPLDPLGSPDDPRWLLWNFGVTSEEQQDHLCGRDPYLAWPEPPLPLPPRKFVFCPNACQLAKHWVNCMLRDDPCALDVELDCGGPKFCRTPDSDEEDAGPPPASCQLPAR